MMFIKIKQINYLQALKALNKYYNAKRQMLNEWWNLVYCSTG